MKPNYTILFILILALCSSVRAQKYTATTDTDISKEWNSNTFNSNKTFLENIEEAKEFQYLSAAYQNPDIIAAIDNEEMVTIFAMIDDSFDAFTDEERDALLSSSEINSIIKYHIVPGRVDSYSIIKAIEKNGGAAYFATIHGETLKITRIDNNITLVDTEGKVAVLVATDFHHKKGFFHIINGIVYPTKDQ